MNIPKKNLLILLAALTAAMAATAFADSNPPITNWINDPVTPLAEGVRTNFYMMCAMTAPFFFGPIIALFYAIYRFDAKRNPKPATWHDNLPLEIAWTVIPALLLVVAAFVTYPLLVSFKNPPKARPDLVVDVVGQQFFWQYTYPRYDVTVVDDGTGVSPLILPVDKVVTFNGTASQVNHAWWVPAFGIKFDVIPGRISNAWAQVKREGFYKGQCAELCGEGHAVMLIHVKVVSDEEFRRFILSKNPEATFDDKTAVAEVPSDSLKDIASANTTIKKEIGQ